MPEPVMTTKCFVCNKTLHKVEYYVYYNQVIYVVCEPKCLADLANKMIKGEDISPRTNM